MYSLYVNNVYLCDIEDFREEIGHIAGEGSLGYYLNIITPQVSSKFLEEIPLAYFEEKSISNIEVKDENGNIYWESQAFSHIQECNLARIGSGLAINKAHIRFKSSKEF